MAAPVSFSRWFAGASQTTLPDRVWRFFACYAETLALDKPSTALYILPASNHPQNWRRLPTETKMPALPLFRSLIVSLALVAGCQHYPSLDSLAPPPALPPPST